MGAEKVRGIPPFSTVVEGIYVLRGQHNCRGAAARLPDLSDRRGTRHIAGTVPENQNQEVFGSYIGFILKPRFTARNS